MKGCDCLLTTERDLNIRAIKIKNKNRDAPIGFFRPILVLTNYWPISIQILVTCSLIRTFVNKIDHDLN